MVVKKGTNVTFAENANIVALPVSMEGIKNYTIQNHETRKGKISAGMTQDVRVWGRGEVGLLKGTVKCFWM